MGYIRCQIIRRPQLADPGSSDSSLCPSNVLYRTSSLLIHNHLEGFLFCCFADVSGGFPLQQPSHARGAFELHAEIALETPCSPPQSAHSRPSNHWLCRPLAAQDVWPSFVPGPPLYRLPRGLCVPAAPPALNTLALEMSLRYALEISAVWALSHALTKGNGVPCWGLMYTLLHSSADGVRYCLQKLLMVPCVLTPASRAVT